MPHDLLTWLLVAAAVLALVAVGWLITRSGSSSGRRAPAQDVTDDGQPAKRAAFVVNPTKFADLPMLHERIRSTCHAQGWSDPLVYETTADDPGEGQARRALAEGVDVVCSLGGDGTVRAVASALVGTETPLGILPAGTGNLLARNLELPTDLDSATVLALTGRDRRIDVGVMTVGAPDGLVDPAEPDLSPGVEHIFLVMGGMGMDAAIMADTNETLKQRVGWAAYMVSGLRSLVSPEFRVRIRLDDDPALRRRARMVIIGNCGKLLGGLVLMPDARIDDGQLDVVIASPCGVVGWVPVATRVVTRRRKGHPTLDKRVCRSVHVKVDRPQPVQIDGDVIGEATSIYATVRPEALTVRAPLA